MKYSLLSLALISVAAGCTTNVEDAGYYLGVVERAANPPTFPGSPFEYMVNGGVLLQSSNEIREGSSGISTDSLEQGQHFDAAVALFRGQTANGLANPNEIPIGHMAFESNGAPNQVGSATINNTALSWTLPGSGSSLAYYAYANTDPNLYGSQDSMAFSYVGFNGETYKDTVGIAPAFGAITFPDTVSVSHGCVISYQHPVLNDSIEIYVNVFDSTFLITRPDTGAIVFSPNQMPLDLTYSNDGFIIYFYRWKWSTQTTPSGKKIGIYSSMETDGHFIPTKP